MRRDLTRLTEGPYDLVIVGGGAYGVCAAWEAALQGLKVALLERDDFGGATSANSLRTIHGGLRYLQHLDLRRMRESIRERRALMRLAPHLIAPLPFVLPTFGHGLRGPEVMAAALAVNDIVAMDRNRGLRADRTLPRGRLLSRSQTQALIQRLQVPGFNGAAMWYDGFNHSPERLVIAIATAAERAGATLANHVEVTGLLVSGGRVRGVAARDRATGVEMEVQARVVLNAAGPWVDSVLSRVSRRSTEPIFRPSKAMNLIVRRLPFDVAIGIPVRRAGSDADALLDKGTVTYFVMPWGDYSLLGTKHLRFEGTPDSLVPQREEVLGFLAEINRVLGDWRLSEDDVAAVQCGLLPESEATPPGGDVVLDKHGKLIDHEVIDGLPGLVSILGVKWTTARLVGEQAVALVCRKLGRPTEARPVESRSLDAAFGAPSSESSPVVDAGTMSELERSYGQGRGAVLAIAREDPALAQRLIADMPVIGAQVAFAARNEMAVNLTDAILRRTHLALGRRLDDSALARCAAVMQREHGWSPAEVARQVAQTRATLGQLNAWRA